MSMQAFPSRGYAFKDVEGRDRDPYDGWGWAKEPENGMTLLDYIATKAMAAMLSTAGSPILGGIAGYEIHTANAAYAMSAAMLEARKSYV